MIAKFCQKLNEKPDISLQRKREKNNKSEYSISDLSNFGYDTSGRLLLWRMFENKVKIFFFISNAQRLLITLPTALLKNDWL
jgi:hypothetical protein